MGAVRLRGPERHPNLENHPNKDAVKGFKVFRVQGRGGCSLRIRAG